MTTLASLLAILALTGLAWAMGFRTSPTLDAAAAAAEAEARLAGFRAADVALAEQGRGALIRGLDGGFALLLPLGDGWVARRLPAGAMQFANGRLTARLDEPMLRQAELALQSRPHWLGAGA
jgi:hypothetical protein